ncbi:MAG: hypothetical protein FJW90_09440 [Actinobacteria bacterium]|nr:hypothetical protein [Actinomycetota bacterium]
MSAALTGLASVGAFMIISMQAALGRVEQQFDKSINSLSSTVTNTNAVAHETALKLEGISRIVERNTETIRDHNSKDADRAHPK